MWRISINLFWIFYLSTWQGADQYLEKVLLKLKKAEYISADLGANRNAVNYCAVRRYYEKVQKRLEQQFLSISLEKMLEQEEEK